MIVDLKPVNVALGAHNIVQLAELDVLDKVDPAELAVLQSLEMSEIRCVVYVY